MNSEDLIKRHEGLRLRPYEDTVGIITIGYGRNLEKGISQDAADFLFNEDMIEVRIDCLKYRWYASLNKPRQAVIENMMFNLGASRFALFKKFINALEIADYYTASVEMLNSKWASQVGNRAIELSKIMLRGDWLDE